VKFRKLAIEPQNYTETRSQKIYEAPDTLLHPDDLCHERHGIWSMGCIYLEFIIWFLYGNAELEKFRDKLGGVRRFYSIKKLSGIPDKEAEVHPTVCRWAEWVKNDPRCSGQTAVGLLIHPVMKRLLFTDLKYGITVEGIE